MTTELITYGPIYATRFPALNYQRIGSDWRMLDVSTGAPIGPRYPTREELLVDLDRVARLCGFDERGAS